MSRRGFLGAAAALGLTPSLLAACGGDSGASSDDSGDLPIAWVLPTTGALASTFAPLYLGGLIAIDEINADGGILGRKLVRKEYDDEASPAREPLVARKVIQEDIQIMCGPTGSSQALSAAAITTPAEILQTSFANDGALGNGTEYPFMYEPIYATASQGVAAARYLADTRELSKIAIIAEATAFGDSAVKASVDTLKEAGIEPVTIERYPADAQDLSQYVRSLESSGAEGVLVWTVGLSPTGQVFNEMNRMNWYPTVAGHSTLFFGTLFDLVPEDALRNVYGTTYKTLSWSDNEKPGKRQMEFARKLAKYPEAKGQEVGIGQGPFYDFLYLIKMAAEEVGEIDPARMKEVLDSTTDYDGLLGKISFTEDDHQGLGVESVTLASALSAKDPQSHGVFRKRAPGL